MDKYNIISKLRQNEEKAIIDGLTMMTYTPSLVGTLEKGGVDKFRNLMIEKVRLLREISSQDEFDEWHHSIVKTIQQEIKTNKGERASYGQAQKPLNVFLKVYVDWASQPTLEKSEQLRKFLHLPLDSIVMKEIKTYYRDKWEEYVVAGYNIEREIFKKRLIKQGKKIDDSDLRRLINPSDVLLSKIIFEGMYYAWQKCVRAIYPEKPVLLDVLWSMKRKE